MQPSPLMDRSPYDPTTMNSQVLLLDDMYVFDLGIDDMVHLVVSALVLLDDK